MSSEEKKAVPFIADAHFDLAPDLWYRHLRGERHILEKHYLPSFAKGGLSLVTTSLFLNDIYLPEMALRGTLDQISVLKEELDLQKNTLALCTTWNEVDKARKEGKTGVIISFEGAEPLMNDPYLLRIFHSLGVRGIGLVWSRRNYLGEGCFFSPRKQGAFGGITDFGVRVMEEAESLGMFIDVSHLNDEGFWDVMDFTTRPVLASHSNCRALVPSMRNLTDDQIRAIGERGGVIGLNVCGAFVAADYKTRKVTEEELAEHTEHIMDLVGEDCPCFGFDFCDQLPSLGFEEFSSDVLKGHGEVPRFLEILRRRGHSEKTIRKIAGENYLTFLKKVLH